MISILLLVDALKRIVPSQEDFSEGLNLRQIPKTPYFQLELGNNHFHGLQTMLFSQSSAPVLRTSEVVLCCSRASDETTLTVTKEIRTEQNRAELTELIQLKYYRAIYIHIL